MQQIGEERLALAVVVTQRKDLLELIDERPARGCPGRIREHQRKRHGELQRPAVQPPGTSSVACIEPPPPNREARCVGEGLQRDGAPGRSTQIWQ